MGDPNEDGRNEGYAPMEETNSKLRSIWYQGLNSLWNTIFTGIVVYALLVALLPLVVLSVLEFVLWVPFGFMCLVCPEINEIICNLLGEPKPRISSYSVCEDLCSRGLGKKEDKYDEEKVKEEGYEQDYDPEEEDKYDEEKAKDGIICILLGEPKPKIPSYSVCEDMCSGDLGKKEDKYDEEKVKEEGYEQDFDPEEEEKELEDDTRRAVEARMEDHSNCQTSGRLGIRDPEASKDYEKLTVDMVEENEYKEVKEYRKESSDGPENGIDIEAVKEMGAFKLEKEMKKRIRADEKQDENKNVAPSTQMTSPFLSWESSGSFGNLEELLAPPETETADGFQEDCDEVEEQKSPKIEPGELVKETMEMVEAVRDEGKVEIENIQQSMEEAMSILPSVSGSVNGAVLDLERVKLLAVEDGIDDVPRLQTINEQMESGKVKKKKKDDVLASLQVEFEHTTNATMEVNTQKMERINPVGDIWNATYRSMGYEKKFEGIGDENHMFGMKGDKG